MDLTRNLLAGAGGALALNAVHQAAQAFSSNAPRMDLVGMRAMEAGHRALGTHVPDERRLYAETFAGDLAANAAYYALVPGGTRRSTWLRGAALGALAGIGALVLPQRLGLGDPPHSETRSNQVMTVAWYLVGGLAAACTAEWLAARDRRRAERASFGLEALPPF